MNGHPTIAGRFNCSSDGTIYGLTFGYALSRSRGPALIGIHPDGSVTNFDWKYIDGKTKVYGPRSVFVGYGRVYVLAKTESEGADGTRNPGFVALIFNLNGTLIRTTPIERWVEPLVLGAFQSGNMVILSEDRLNYRMAIDLIAPDGSPIRQLDLGREDYLALASAMPDEPGKYNASFLIASSTFHPFGDDLLLIPTVSGLPTLTLSQQGIVKAVTLKVPANTILSQFISSTPSTLKFRLATIILTAPRQMDQHGKQMGMTFTPTLQITDFSLANGSVLHQANFGSSDVQPACEAGGFLRLLTSIGTSGFLAVTSERAP